MRIRKSASKILGSAVACHAPPPPPPHLDASNSSWASPPPPPPSRWGSQAFVSSAAASEIICALNQSPWDLLLPDLDLFQENVCEGDEEEDTTGSIFGNKIKVEDKTVTPPLMAAFASEEKKLVKMGRKNPTKKAMKKIDERMEAFSRKKYTNCKKNDGKGWHCKRPAKCPNTLCDYHLSQLRSYSNCGSGASADNSSRATAAATSATTATTPQAENHGKEQQKKKKKPVSAGAGDFTSDYYYYYSGFGPSRGKRRGKRSGIEDANMAEEEEEDEEEDEKVSAAPVQTPARLEYVDGHNEYVDDHNDGPVAGDDEEDNYDDDDGFTSRDVKEAEHKKTFRAKRGRKPVKARSLKSLL